MVIYFLSLLYLESFTQETIVINLVDNRGGGVKCTSFLYHLIFAGIQNYWNISPWVTYCKNYTVPWVTSIIYNVGLTQHTYIPICIFIAFYRFSTFSSTTIEHCVLYFSGQSRVYCKTFTRVIDCSKKSGHRGVKRMPLLC